MQEQILDISREQIGNLIKELKNPAKLDSVTRELKRMLITRQRIALEADVG